MKTYQRIALGAGTAGILALGVFSSSVLAQSMTTTPTYCNTSTSTEGYFVTTDQSSYPQGQNINICLTDNTNNPLFLEGTHPWAITDQNGTIVFTPTAGTLVNNPEGTGFFTDIWNGMNASSTAVTPGTYTVTFAGFPGSPSAMFNITSNSSGDISSTTSTTTPNNPDLSTLITQLQSLQIMFPGFSGGIQGIINQLMGSGTTVGNTAGATIDQNGQTFSAGGSIDFSGRNFGHEETVTVTLGGATVVTAHADGGGNFSTGSFSLPSTPGTYTYTFTGGSSGMTATATITLQ